MLHFDDNKPEVLQVALVLVDEAAAELSMPRLIQGGVGRLGADLGRVLGSHRLLPPVLTVRAFGSQAGY